MGDGPDGRNAGDISPQIPDLGAAARLNEQLQQDLGNPAQSSRKADTPDDNSSPDPSNPPLLHGRAHYGVPGKNNPGAIPGLTGPPPQNDDGNGNPQNSGRAPYRVSDGIPGANSGSDNSSGGGSPGTPPPATDIFQTPDVNVQKLLKRSDEALDPHTNFKANAIMGGLGGYLGRGPAYEYMNDLAGRTLKKSPGNTWAKFYQDNAGSSRLAIAKADLLGVNQKLMALKDGLSTQVKIITDAQAKPGAAPMTPHDEAIKGRHGFLGRERPVTDEYLKRVTGDPGSTLPRAQLERKFLQLVDDRHSIFRDLTPEDLKLTQKLLPSEIHRLAKGGALSRSVTLAPTDLASARKLAKYAPADLERISTLAGPDALLELDDVNLILNRSRFTADLSAERARLSLCEGMGPTINNIGKGVALAGVYEFACDRTDRFLNQKFGNMHEHGSWYTDSIAVPLAATLALERGGKLPWIAAGVAMFAAHEGGNALDALWPASEKPAWSEWMRPSGLDTLAVTAACLWPTKGGAGVRTAMVAGAWGLGKLGAGTFDHLVTGPTARELNNNVLKEWDKDKTERTASSMMSSIDAVAQQEHYRQGETWVQAYLADWTNPKHWSGAANQDDVLTAYRRAAILLAGDGKARMQAGTNVGIHNGSGNGFVKGVQHALLDADNASYDDFILRDGQNIDLDNAALISLATAKVQIASAQRQVDAMSAANQSSNGTVVKPEEKEDLDQVNQNVDDMIKKIRDDKHDINAAYDELLHYFPGRPEQYLAVIQSMDANLKALQGNSVALEKVCPGQKDAFEGVALRNQALAFWAYSGGKVGVGGVGSGKDPESAVDDFVVGLIAYRDAASKVNDHPDLDALRSKGSEVKKNLFEKMTDAGSDPNAAVLKCMRDHGVNDPQALLNLLDS